MVALVNDTALKYPGAAKLPAFLTHRCSLLLGYEWLFILGIRRRGCRRWKTKIRSTKKAYFGGITRRFIDSNKEESQRESQFTHSKLFDWIPSPYRPIQSCQSILIIQLYLEIYRPSYRDSLDTRATGPLVACTQDLPLRDQGQLSHGFDFTPQWSLSPPGLPAWPSLKWVPGTTRGGEVAVLTPPPPPSVDWSFIKIRY